MSTATLTAHTDADHAHLGSAAVVASLAAIGAASVGVLRLVMPYDTADTAPAMVHKVYAHPGAQSLVLWLALVAALTLVPGVLAIGRFIRPGAPRLTAVGLVLLVAGYLALPSLAGGDLLPWLGQRSGVPEATLATLAGTDHPTSLVAAGIFVLGHVLGTVLLGLAMWRSGMVPRWVALATVVAQPLHFVFAVLVTNHPLDFAAWLLNAVGYAAAAIVMARR